MFDVTAFHGAGEPPRWAPRCGGFTSGRDPRQPLPGVFVIDEVLSAQDCEALIAGFEAQEHYPVGVDGYADAEDRIGSHRAMAWAVETARAMAPAFEPLPRVLHGREGDLVAPSLAIPAPFPTDRTYRRIGATPWMRFMRYRGDGMHVPHYDAPYECAPERYITLFSWVLYLSDVPDADGGALQFVDDGRRDHPRSREPQAFADWRRMAAPEEITLSVQPRRGRLLVFPHWLCHQVALYAGAGCRDIVRGDLAYGVEP